MSKELKDEYLHDTVYCKILGTIDRQISEMYNTYIQDKHKVKLGLMIQPKAEAYKQLVKDKDTLFDVATEDQTRKARMKEVWVVTMGLQEALYLEDQRHPRQMELILSGLGLIWQHRDSGRGTRTTGAGQGRPTRTTGAGQGRPFWD